MTSGEVSGGEMTQGEMSESLSFVNSKFFCCFRRFSQFSSITSLIVVFSVNFYFLRREIEKKCFVNFVILSTRNRSLLSMCNELQKRMYVQKIVNSCQYFVGLVCVFIRPIKFIVEHDPRISFILRSISLNTPRLWQRICNKHEQIHESIRITFPMVCFIQKEPDKLF